MKKNEWITADFIERYEKKPIYKVMCVSEKGEEYGKPNYTVSMAKATEIAKRHIKWSGEEYMPFWANIKRISMDEAHELEELFGGTLDEMTDEDIESEW